VPLSVVGLLLATRVWNAKPQSKAAPHPAMTAGVPPAQAPRTGTGG
jgi:OPA family glycerol-3-phosphate transporter-like MFS transporter